jgi:hypothetical protein
MSLDEVASLSNVPNAVISLSNLLYLLSETNSL